MSSHTNSDEFPKNVPNSPELLTFLAFFSGSLKIPNKSNNIQQNPTPHSKFSNPRKRPVTPKSIMKSTIIYSLLAAAAACGMAFGQTTAYSAPVGYVSQALPANSFSFVGLTAHQPAAYSGIVTSASSSSVTASGIDFATLLTEGQTYVLELADGTIQEVNSWTAQGVLTTPDNISSKITPNVTKFKLRKAATISDIFGANNAAGLKSTDGDIDSADVIYLVGSGGAVTPVYYYNDGSEQAWYTAEGEPAGDLPLVYGDGFYIGRKAGDPLNLVVSGEVKTVPTSGVVAPGWNFLSGVAPAGLTLGNSGLKNFLSSTDGDYLTVDNIYIPNPDGSFTIAYYYDDGSEAEWYTADGEPAADLQLNGGFLIFSRSSTKNYTLNVPTSYSSL